MSPEERQRERRRLLVEAAYRLLSEDGVAATTVRAVCAEARLNPRYFYESFEELDELLVAVYDDVVVQLATEIADRVRAAGPTLEDSIRCSVAGTVEFIEADRRRGRILYTEALGNEALNRRRMQTGFELVELIQRDRARRDAQFGATEVGRLSAAMLVGGFSEMLAAWLDDRISLDADALIEAATELFGAITERATYLATGNGTAG